MADEARDAITVLKDGPMSPAARALFERMNLLFAAESVGDTADALSLMVASLLMYAHQLDRTADREALRADFMAAVKAHMDANPAPEFASAIGSG